MLLNPVKVAFGRHETFPLRFSWLPKGIQALEKDPKVFESHDATVRLGVGKNMVNAIRYWLRASQMIEPDSYQMTELGKLILSNKGFDPYLEDEGTLWLLHWLVVSDPQLATAHFWFFNRFHKREFTSEELRTALSDFVDDALPRNKRPAKSTIASDSAVIPRMYTQSKITQRMPLEEALDSPFALLKLIEHKSSEKVFVSTLADRNSLPIEIVAFAVVSIMNYRGQYILPIEDLMYGKDNYAVPGSAFRLSENGFIRKLEQLVAQYPGVLDIRESSGIHQLFLLEEVDPILFIKHYYQPNRREVAA